MASVVKEKNGYRVFVAVKGKRKSKSFRLRKDAVDWGNITEANLSDATDDKHTFYDLLDKYRREVSPKKRGEKWESHRIDVFMRKIADRLLNEVTSDVLGAYRDERLKEVGNGSVIRDFTLLSAIFEFARRELKWVRENPARDVRKPKAPQHRDVVITRQQVKAIVQDLGYSPTRPIRTISQSVALAFLLALRTGMRAGELCSLTWDKLHDGYFVLEKTKTNPRHVPLSNKALRLIEKAKGIDNKSVFLLSPATLDSLFRKSKARCGITNVTFHDSRHTAATWMAHKLRVLDLCKAFGWSNPKYAMIYYNPKAKDIADMLNRKQPVYLNDAN